MRIITVGRLRDFWRRPGRDDAEQPLRAWVHVVRAAEWSKPTDVKEMFRSADIVPNGRIVFNIGGNKYRLVVAVTTAASEYTCDSLGRTKSTTRSM
jgi:mRNA interferase HigB